MLVASTPSEKEEVYRFRYSIYVDEQRKSLSYADHGEKSLTDELDASSTILYIKHEGEIIATLRKSWGGISEYSTDLVKAYDLMMFDAFPSHTMCITSRLMVHPSFRPTAALSALFAHAYKISRERGCRFDFCNCAVERVPLMLRLGYRRYKPNFIDPDVGERVPLVGLYEDIEYLHKVRFPFIDEALRWSNPVETSAWFAATFSPSMAQKEISAELCLS